MSTATRMTEKITYEEAEKQLIWGDSYQRAGMLFNLYRSMNEDDWLRLLGREWSSCDNTCSLKNWLKLLLERRTYPQMMDEEELAKFELLPDVVTIYRGCGRGVNMDGISWSLDKEIASKFPTYHRYRVKHPVLITATVKKSKIIALKLDRKEQEVITFSAKRISVEEL
jgi:hypothetical protein